MKNINKKIIIIRKEEVEEDLPVIGRFLTQYY